MNTLGVLLFRLGQYEEAIEALHASDARYSAMEEGGVPEDVAFLALSHRRLGQDAEAKKEYARLLRIMERPANAEKEDRRAVCEEARREFEAH